MSIVQKISNKFEEMKIVSEIRKKILDVGKSMQKTLQEYEKSKGLTSNPNDVLGGDMNFSSFVRNLIQKEMKNEDIYFSMFLKDSEKCISYIRINNIELSVGSESKFSFKDKSTQEDILPTKENLSEFENIITLLKDKKEEYLNLYIEDYEQKVKKAWQSYLG